MVGVEEGREFRFRGDLYSQESTFPLVMSVSAIVPEQSRGNSVKKKKKKKQNDKILAFLASL